MASQMRKSLLTPTGTSSPKISKISKKTKDILPPTPPSSFSQTNKSNERSSRKSRSPSPILFGKTQKDSLSNVSTSSAENFGIDDPVDHADPTNERGKSYSDLKKAHDALHREHKRLQNKYNDLEAKQDDMQNLLNELSGKVNKSKKNKVTPRKEIRSYVRMAYRENDKEWSFKQNDSAFSKDNIEISAKIKENVAGVDSSASDEEINSAISTYYASLRGYTMKKRKNPNSAAHAAKYQRKQHKLSQRKEALLAKTSITEERKAKVGNCLIIEMMSSEDEEDDGTFSIRPLVWRSRRMEKVLEGLDAKVEVRKTKRARRQTAKRVIGEPSEREPPAKIVNNPDFSWAISEEST